MYRKDAQGNRIPIVLNQEAVTTPPQVEAFQMKEDEEKKEGSNKGLLYVTLVAGLIIVAGSGYLLYKSQQKI